MASMRLDVHKAEGPLRPYLSKKLETTLYELRVLVRLPNALHNLGRVLRV